MECKDRLRRISFTSEKRYGSVIAKMQGKFEDISEKREWIFEIKLPDKVSIAGI